MGIRGLTSYLRYSFKRVNLERTAKLRIGVDAMSILYKFKGAHDELITCLRTIKRAGHSLFFVYDGKTPVEKEREVSQRAELRDAPLRELERLRESSAFFTLSSQEKQMIHERLRDLGARSWRMTRDMHNKFKGELWREEIPYLKSIEEADTVLVDMYKCGKIDVIMSTDMDYLMAGVERMFIPSVASAHPIFQEVLLQDVLTNECMNFESFQEACILCGTDVTKEFCRMEPARAFSYIRYYATIKNMVRLKKDFIPPQFTEEYIESVKQRWRVVSGAWDNARPDHLARLVEKGMLTL